MKITITTQYSENYGAHSWNGEGECPQYWKNKGGEEYVIDDVPCGFFAQGEEKVLEFVRTCAEIFGCVYQSDYACEHILDWQVVEDDYISWSEQSQLEYEGFVQYPTKRMNYSELTF